MNKFFFTYDDALEIVSEYLQGIKNVKEFCATHELGYMNVLNIRAKRNKEQYPKLIKKILEIMGYEVETEVCFTIEKGNILKK